MNRKTAEKLALYVVSGVLVFVLFVFCVHLPLQRACSETVQETRAVTRQVAAIQTDKQHYGDGKADAALVQQQKAADEALPDGVEQSALLSMLQKTAWKHGIALTAMTPGRAVPRDKLLVQPVHLSCETDYFSLLAFLRELRGQSRFLRLDEAHIRSRGGHLSCEITLSAFAMPVEE